MKQTPQSRRLNEVVREALAAILLTEVSDPRLDFTSITSVEVSRDRSVANVFVTADQARYQEVEAGLASARGRIRSLLGQRLSWRVTPELRFYLDSAIDTAQRINAALATTPKTLAIAKDEEGYPL
ncbi:MAG: 30S ribosome-binding factor RbfA [Coriobacteriales bacterium]|jgi:ribosome-binding factor A|nr:30S ribosome-binding factor RbfA [Coriobacteriales bacterium]